ncbi:hypothetical protein ColTof4_02857 [Colletotrichum tofieldiae]|nr:hypothetical protein ColTof3_08844 [Colletotrichum tofieldiae]GKT70434.1 hypothetical protein ColTof4_02857 [Colletotrichum tofieldiae]
MVAISAAKDCAFFYDRTAPWPNRPDVATSNAQWYCEHDIGGKMDDSEANIPNSKTNENFRCGICRGARKSTKDYTIPDKIGNYTVRCGVYAHGKCGAE